MRSLVALLALVAAGCSAPLPPGPYPADFVPSASPSPSLDASLLSPDGFDAAQRMTVRVRNVGCETILIGTGFAVGEHTLVTAGHVVEGSRRLQVTTYDGQTFEATATGTTTVADLAIVHVEESLTALGVLAESDPTVSDAVTIVGYPGGGRLTTIRAVVITTDPEDIDPEVGPAFGATVSLEAGMSGAPVLNSDGEVVGVVYGASESLPQSFFIPVSTLRTLLDQPPTLVPESAVC
ncbi:MAG: trypsin-like peptidase domain-containing protein [Demequinaceae bacterium]|nr:trypsin-like peptidase domain-containing protein [Demequinaceae bacterium]